MNKDEITIPEPCAADWAEMTGDARKRFCAQCSKHVHNLSEMTEPEAREVLATPDVCVRFSACADGTVRFQSRRRFLAAAVASTVALPAAAAVTPQEPTAPSLLSRLLDYVFGEPAPEPVQGGIAPIAEPPPEPIEDIQGGAVWEPEPIEPVEPIRPLMGKPMPPQPQPPEDE